MNQIKVELLQNNHDDLFVVNAARVSFNVWKDQFEDKDQGLLNYLAWEKHSSPFRHVRVAFSFNMLAESHLPTREQLNPYQQAGMVVHETEDGGLTIIKHSLFGWANLIYQGYGSDSFRRCLGHWLHKLFPACAAALSIRNNKITDQFSRNTDMLDEDQLTQFGNPWLIDVSLRCKVPIWLSRQLVKHQVGLSWNEVSRRYVSSPVELFDQELRMAPEGSIKQGSGEVCNIHFIPRVSLCDDDLCDDEASYHINSIMYGLALWYDECIQANIAPETIRGYMPLNMMTEYIWSGSLPAFAHMVNLRSEGHAQKEAQYFAQQVDAILKEAHPEHWKQLTNQN